VASTGSATEQEPLPVASTGSATEQEFPFGKTLKHNISQVAEPVEATAPSLPQIAPGG